MDYSTALLAGAVAGTAVDLSLFPLDTLKTRLQAGPGQFWASGGFSGIYRGIGSVVVGSAPGAALFFVTYEGVKKGMSGSGSSTASSHMLAASLGEIAACAVRVPTEVVKQRAQAGQHASSAAALAAIIRTHRRSPAALVRALYRGAGATVLREVPFTVVQFPLWEAMRTKYQQYQSSQSQSPLSSSSSPSPSSLPPPSSVASALFGSLAGAFAAAVTTPLDVLKTRIMLSPVRQPLSAVVRDILARQGPRAFFAGIGPRVTWISIGGAIFLGTYQLVANALGNVVADDSK